MGQTRREFIRSTTAALSAAGFVAPSSIGRLPTDTLVSPYSPIVAAEPNIKELAAVALEAAKGAGAEYADVRFVRNRNQNVSTREQRVTNAADNETYIAKYRSLIEGYGWTPESFSTDYPHTIRIRPTRVRLDS